MDRDPAGARRRHEVFGDVLPDATSDEAGEPAPAEDDRWYAENRPPHHDRD